MQLAPTNALVAGEGQYQQHLGQPGLQRQDFGNMDPGLSVGIDR